MKGPEEKPDLEDRVRKLVYERGTSRSDLNELLRNCEEARAIAARVLVEEAALVSELRLENAQDWVKLLERGETSPSQAKGAAKGVRWLRRAAVISGLTAACLTAALWFNGRDRKEEEQDRSAATGENRDWEESVGWIRLMAEDGFTARFESLSKGQELRVGPEGARIDLDNGVVISVIGSADMIVDLHSTWLQQGTIFVEVPKEVGLYAVETREGVVVDLGNEFRVSVDPGQETEVMVLKGKGKTFQITDPDDDPKQGTPADGNNNHLSQREGGIQVIEIAEMPERPAFARIGSALRVPDAYRELVDSAKPLLAWDFETAVDGDTIPNRSGPELDGIIKGGAQLIGEAGMNQHLQLGHKNQDGWLDVDTPWLKEDKAPFTLELWARPDLMQWGHLFQLRVDSEFDPVFRYRQGGIITYFCLELTHLSQFHPMAQRPAVRAAFRTPATAHGWETVPGGLNSMLLSPKRYRPGHWHHLVARVGDHDFTLFVNGTIAAKETIERPDHGEQKLILRLGRLYGKAGLTRQFVGAIDEVALYPRALRDEEIARHYKVMTGTLK